MKGLWPLCSVKAEGKQVKLHDLELIKVLILTGFGILAFFANVSHVISGQIFDLMTLIGSGPEVFTKRQS